MRASIGGWLANSSIHAGRPAMPAVATFCGSSPASSPPRRRSAPTMGWALPISCAAPASARNSRWRENHATMMLASTPKTNYEDDDPDHVGITNCYEIRQVSALGVESTLSLQGSNRICAASQPQAPVVTATAKSASQIAVSWTGVVANQYRVIFS